MRVEMRSMINHTPYLKSPLCSEFLKTPDLQKKKQKGIENPRSAGKTQIWHRWPYHFESSKKVTQLIEQVNVM